MINKIETDIIVSGNGHYDIITGWFWYETKKQMIYSQTIEEDRNNAWDKWAMVHDNIMTPICTAINLPELNHSYFSFIMRDLKH